MSSQRRFSDRVVLLSTFVVEGMHWKEWLFWGGGGGGCTAQQLSCTQLEPFPNSS